MPKKISGKYVSLTFKLDMVADIQKQLGKKFVTRVGVIGNDARTAPVATVGESKSELTNAQIGLIHEKGSYVRNIPQRSFLFMPLSTKLPEYYKKLGPGVLNSLTAKNIQAIYTQLGIVGENIVQRAFATSGFGKWEKSRVNGRVINLIDTGQLRKSIHSDVVAK